jgi:hypothetical protein
MGDPSYLRFVPASSATIPIDWSKVPDASKKFLLNGWGTNWSSTDTTKKRPLPTTIEGLAKMFDKTKFFGYMRPELCTLLLDISEFGLAETHTEFNVYGLPVGPHFYMKYISEVWFVLFVPGQRDGMLGYSSKLPYLEEEDEEAARDKKVAEDFDPGLCEEVRRWGTVGAEAMQKVAGWEGFTIRSSLEIAQMADETRKLPIDHPAHIAMMQSVFRALRR